MLTSLAPANAAATRAQIGGAGRTAPSGDSAGMHGKRKPRSSALDSIRLLADG